MEIIYPDNFLRHYNEDDEIDDVGEFELINSLDDYILVEEKTTYDKPVSYRGIENFTNEMGSNIGSSVYYTDTNIESNKNHNLANDPNTMTRVLPFPPRHIRTNNNPNSQNVPMGPPPSYVPSKNDQNVKSLGNTNGKNLTGPSIKPCLFRFTYIWQTNGRCYWAYLTRVDNRSISGWRWMGWRWVYFGLDLRRIESFMCI